VNLALIQYKSVPGNIEENIKRHINWIEKAQKKGADFVVFPELSLTGYEPSLAKSLALSVDDSRLDVFQDLSNEYKMVIAIGAPIIKERKVYIGCIIYKPNQNRTAYLKTYLHADELAYFSSGQNKTSIIHEHISLAICYEISVKDHINQAMQDGAQIYIASVAKHRKGIDEASKTIQHLIDQFKIPVLLVNAVGPSDDFIASGNSSIWNASGTCNQELNCTEEGILLYKTEA